MDVVILSNALSASTEHMIFILVVVNVVYYTDWFAYVESSLCPWNEPHLIVMYYF